MSPANLPHNLKLVDLVKTWAIRKQTTPARIAIGWLLAQKPWIVPIRGTTQMSHMVDNAGGPSVVSTASELAELNAAVRAFEAKGGRMPPQVQAMSGVEARRRTA